MSDTLQTIQELGARLASEKATLLSLEGAASGVKETIRQMEEVDLPALMDEIGIEEIKLEGGHKITCKDLIHARLKDPAAAFSWLRENQGDGIIKNEITVKLNRGEDDRAERIKEDLTTRGVDFDHKETIHASTLKSYVAEVLNNPDLRDSLPREAFGVYEGRKVTFK